MSAKLARLVQFSIFPQHDADTTELVLVVFIVKVIVTPLGMACTSEAVAFPDT
jgi:hypothetical protein